MISRRLRGGDEAYYLYVEEADDPLGRGRVTPTKVALEVEMEKAHFATAEY